MTRTEVIYRPCTGATPESEIAVLADVYRFVLDTAMKEGSRPGAPNAGKEINENPAKPLYPSRDTEEVWFLFDCRGPGAKSRLHRERRAWGSRSTMESLGYGHVVLVVRPGGALELAR